MNTTPRFGADNSFFGKRHSEKTRELLSHIQKQRHEEGFYQRNYSQMSSRMRVFYKSSKGKRHRRALSRTNRGSGNPSKRPEVQEKLRGSNHWNWKGGVSYVKRGLHIYGYSYKAARRACLRRDGYRCRVKYCRNREQLEAHHIIPKSRGGGNELTNLVTLCRIHHPRSPFGTAWASLPPLRSGIKLKFPEFTLPNIPMLDALEVALAC